MPNICLKENEIHIYQIELSKPDNEIIQLENLLSEDELIKSRSYKYKNLRDCYVAGRGTLRKILGRYLDTPPQSLRISYKTKGKPYIEDNEIKFNLSHSKDIAVYAFTLYDEVGIDVEQIREIPDSQKIAQRFFSPEEYTTLMGMEKELVKFTFLNCWTRKEAFIKSNGNGLSYPLECFSVSSRPGTEPKMIWIKDEAEEAALWTLYNIDAADGYISSLSLKNKSKKLVYLKGF